MPFLAKMYFPIKRNQRSILPMKLESKIHNEITFLTSKHLVSWKLLGSPEVLHKIVHPVVYLGPAYVSWF